MLPQEIQVACIAALLVLGACAALVRRVMEHRLVEAASSPSLDPEYDLPNRAALRWQLTIIRRREKRTGLRSSLLAVRFDEHVAHPTQLLTGVANGARWYHIGAGTFGLLVSHAEEGAETAHLRSVEHQLARAAPLRVTTRHHPVDRDDVDALIDHIVASMDLGLE